MKKFLMVLLALGLSGYLSASTTLEGGDAQQLKRRYDPDTKEIFQSVTGTTLVQISQTLDAILAASGGGGDVNLTHIDDTSVANQSNAPGWMPSAMGDGFGNPIDSNVVGSSINGTQGLAVIASLQSGYGDVLDSTSPGDWFNGNDPTNYIGLATVTSLDAVGGVATNPAQNIADGFYIDDDDTGTFNAQAVAALIGGWSDADNAYEYVSVNYEGDGATSSSVDALAVGNWFWGGVAVSPALRAYDMEAGFYMGDTEFSGPFVHAGIVAYDPVNQYTTAVTAAYDDNYGTFAIDTRIRDWGGVPLAVALPLGYGSWGSGDNYPLVGALATYYIPDDDYTQAVGPDTPLPVSAPQAFNTSGVISTTGIITIGVNKLLQNFTAQLVWEGSVGADTFTALLQGSYDGVSWITLATITEGTSGLKAQIQGYPYPYTRLNLSALTLDTATGITLNAAGMQ